MWTMIWLECENDESIGWDDVEFVFYFDKCPKFIIFLGRSVVSI